MLTLDDIWLQLTTEDIGFYTRRRSARIPPVPGVYGWFLPMRMRSNPTQLMTLARRIHAYDSGSRGVGTWTSDKAGFRWDPLRIEVARQPLPQVPERLESAWSSIAKAPVSVRKQFEKALFVSSIFSRPLYVGLTNNLARRYQEHVSGTPDSNNFHSRFSSYMREIDESLTIEQLLFVCIPLRKAPDESDDLTQEQIVLLEFVLKSVCQPVFDDR